MLIVVRVFNNHSSGGGCPLGQRGLERRGAEGVHN